MIIIIVLGISKHYYLPLTFSKESAAEQKNIDLSSFDAQNPQDQYQMGISCYQDHYGYGLDYYEYDKVALEWFEKAAKQNHPDAQFYLGKMYRDGIDGATNHITSRKWLKKAADQNHAEAQLQLGLIYENGITVSQNDAKAFSWFEKAASQGNTRAESKLASLYLKGQGSPKNIPKAIEYFQKAATKNDPDVQYTIISDYLKTHTPVSDKTLEKVKRINSELSTMIVNEDFQRNVNPKKSIQMV